MIDQGFDLSEIFDEPRIKALANALGIDEGEVLSALMDGLNERYPDSSHDDTLAYANAIRDMSDEGWVTPDNLDSLSDEGEGPGVDSNGNGLGDDEDDFDDEDDDGFDFDDDDEDDDGFDFDDDDEEEDDDDIDSDERIKDRKSRKGCVSDETMKNIVGALANI